MIKQPNITIEEIRADICNPSSNKIFVVNKKAKKEILDGIEAIEGQTDIFGGVMKIDRARLKVQKFIRNFFVFE